MSDQTRPEQVARDYVAQVRGNMQQFAAKTAEQILAGSPNREKRVELFNAALQSARKTLNARTDLPPSIRDFAYRTFSWAIVMHLVEPTGMQQ